MAYDSYQNRGGFGSCLNMQNEPFTRPQSVINIVEIPDASVSNPSPISASEASIGEFISPQKLKEVSGVSDLSKLIELKIKVDTNETSIGNIGNMAPNLKTLNLCNSYVTSIRDLGTNFHHLSTLWLSRCCLADLDGVSCINTLKELYMAYNEICDISPLSMLEHLQVLDLEGNNIDDITQVEFLTLCSQLTVVTLRGNPLEHAPTSISKEADLKYYSYRDAVLTCLPQLLMLDDEAFLIETINGEQVKRSKPGRQVKFKNDLQIIQESLKNLETEGLEDDDVNKKETCTMRPLSARIRCKSAKVTENAAKPEPSSSPRSNCEEDTATTKFPTDFLYDADHSSELTHGNVMCGNPVQALRHRNRKKAKDIVDEEVKQEKEAEKNNTTYIPERSFLTDSERKQSTDDILQELKQWRINNERLFQDTMGDRVNIEPSSKRQIGTIPKGGRNTDQPTPSSPPTYSPVPPTVTRSKPSRISPNILRRSLPTPPPQQPPTQDRPQTSHDFRSRRYRLMSADAVMRKKEVDENSNLCDNEKNHPLSPKRPATRAALQYSNS